MEGKPFLITVDMSSILKIRDSNYILLINPTEISLMYHLKQWIQFLFDVKFLISIKHENMCIHDLETIEILKHLQGPLRIEIGDTQIGKDDFLNRLQDTNFSCLSPHTKKRLLGSAKVTGVNYSDFSRESISSTPAKNLSAQENEKDDTDATAQNDDNEMPSVDCSNQAVNGNMEVNSQVGSNGQRKGIKPMSVGAFLTDLRASCNTNNILQAPTEETVSDTPELLKRKRVRRHKPKKTQHITCDEASWELPPPNETFNGTPCVSHHIRFESESAPGGNSPEKNNKLNSDPSECSELVENGNGSATQNKNLDLLFSLRNAFGSPPVFLREITSK